MAINFFGVRHGLTLGSLTSAPLSPLNGDIYFDGTLGKFQFYQDNQWNTYGDPLKTYTLGKVLQSNDITGLIEASAVDSTVLAYLDATSSIQNQLNSKVDKSLYAAKGDILVRNATTPIPLGIGLDGQVLTVDLATATGVKWATVNAANTTLSNLVSPTSVNQSLVASDPTKSLGSSLTPWFETWVYNQRLKGSTTGILTIKASDATTTYDLVMPSAQGTVSTVLTNDGAGNLSWTTPSGTGANTTLSNLTIPTSINQDLIPNSDGSKNLGSNLKMWNKLYVNTITDSSTVNSIDSTGRFLTDSVGGSALEWANSTNPGLVSYLNFVPNITTLNLGSLTKRWESIYGLNHKFVDSTATNTVTVKAPDTFSSSYTLTLPTDDGTSGQLLATDGSGNLSWASPAAAGANTTLSNLVSPTAINQDLIPATSKNLGSFTDYWNKLYVGLIYNINLVDVPAIDVSSNYLLDNTSYVSLDWSGRSLNDSVGGGSLLWDNRELRNINLETVFNWYGPSNISIYKDLIPAAGHTPTIGTNTSPWTNVYTKGVKLLDSTVHEITIIAPTTVTPHTLTLPSALGTNGQVLTTDNTGHLSWSTVAGTGANTALSNLVSPTAINQDLIPSSYRNLGTLANPWNQIYANEIVNAINGTAIDIINNYLIGTEGSSSLDWSGRSLYDVDGSQSLDWSNSVNIITYKDILPSAAFGNNLGTNVYPWNFIKSNVMGLVNPSNIPINISAPSSLTTYSLVLPSAQGAAATVLTNDGTGNLTWTTPAGTGANKSLSNLTSPTSVNQDLIPGSFKNLGSFAHYWNRAYVNELVNAIDGTAIDLISNLLIGTEGSTSLDWSARSLYDVDGNQSFNWVDASDIISYKNILPSSAFGNDLGTNTTPWSNIKSANLGLVNPSNSSINISSPNILSPYSLVLPNAQGAVSTVLTNDGFGNLFWSTVAGTGANTALSNLTSPTSVNQDLIPSDLTKAMGSSTAPWLEMWSYNQKLKGATSGTLTVKAADTTTSHTLVMPSAVGSNGQVLTTDASGNLSWVTPVPFASPIFTGIVSTPDIKITNLASSSDTARGIVYTDTLGNLEIDTLDLIWDETNKRLGINQQGSVSSATIDIHSTTFTTPIAQFNQKSTTQSAGGGSIIQLQADPSAAMLTNSRIGVIQFAGATDASHTTAIGSGITSVATENWSASANGSKMGFYTTQNGTTGRVLSLLLDQDQSASFSANVSITGTTSLSKEIIATQISTPSTPSAGTNKIYAKSDDKLYILNSSGVETQVGSGGATGYLNVVTTSSSTYSLSSSNDVLLCNCTSTSQTITLPSPTGLSGKVFNIKKTDGTANTVTISGGTIDGDGPITISAKNESKTIVTDGSNWFII